MKKQILLVLSVVCVLMLGCTLDSNSCRYNSDENLNQYECKDMFTMKSCQPDGLWEEKKCPNGCGENGRCVEITSCSDNEIGKFSCTNGKLSKCVKKQDEDPHYEHIADCSSGCNDEGTACIFNCKNCPLGCTVDGSECAKCNANKCENGSLKICKDDNSGYEDATNCPLGCNDAGTACATCENSKCENGSLKICKDDKSGYRDATTCLKGCNAEGTDCDNSCTDDFCKDGFVYRCINNSLTAQGEKCPDIHGKSGSCANTTSCMECDETDVSQRRRCTTPVSYQICQNGVWGTEVIQCPGTDGSKFCDAAHDACTGSTAKTHCIDDQLWTIEGDDMKGVPCPNHASCKDNSTCGECRSGEDTKCDNNVYSICHEGGYQTSACSLGWGCHTDEQGKGICNECNANHCENNTSAEGKFKACSNGVFAEESQCKVAGEQVSCQSETECGECKTGAVKCDANVLKTCSSGKWTVTLTCSGNTPICDAKGKQCVSQSAICQKNGEYRCYNDSVQLCNDGYWGADHDCKFGCNENTSACYPDCKPGNKLCDKDNNKDNIAMECDENGVWQTTKCGSGICSNGQCLECKPGDSKCIDAKSSVICGDDGKWGSVKLPCDFGCNATSGTCYPECAPGEVLCSGVVRKICTENGIWEERSCQFGCDESVGECYPECKPGTKQCNEEGSSLVCNNKGRFEVVKCSKIGCNPEIGECIMCEEGVVKCNDALMSICHNNSYIDIKCTSINSHRPECKGDICYSKCNTGKDNCIFVEGISGYVKFDCVGDNYDFKNIRLCEDQGCKSCE